MLYLQLLGRFRLTSEAEHEMIDLKRQSATFLAYFAMHRGRRIANDAIIEQFWPECDPTRGRSNLRSAIWRLRKAIGQDGRALIEHSSCGESGLSDQGRLRLDIEEFESTIKRTLDDTRADLDGGAVAALRDGLRIYKGDLMPGWYDDWVLVERERLQGLYVAGLQQLMNYQAEQHLLDASIDTGRRILKVEPLRESVHRRLIELYIETGQPGAAHSQYQKCVRLLLAELGVAPSCETRGAHARLKKTFAPSA